MLNLRTLAARVAARPRTASAPPIGADFAATALNLVQATPRGDGFTLVAAVSIPYPAPRADLLAAPAELARFVGAALASRPFKGRRVISALPPADVRILPLTLAPVPGQSDAQAVGKAAAEQLGIDARDAVLDYYPIRGADGDSGGKQVLVACAEKSRVLAYLAMLETARLEPVALDIGPAAIARLLAAIHGSDIGQSILLLNFGSAKSLVTVIWGRRLMLDREIDFGEQHLAATRGAARDLPHDTATRLLRLHGIGDGGSGAAPRDGGGGDDGDAHAALRGTIHEVLHPACLALADELAHTQVYVASRTRGSTISRVYLNGSLARYPDIQARIGALIDVPVHLLDPLDAFGAAGARAAGTGDDIGRSIALAAGLALRGASHG
jgi:Tfp pilus assembly PilM family ATPase